MLVSKETVEFIISNWSSKSSIEIAKQLKLSHIEIFEVVLQENFKIKSLIRNGLSWDVDELNFLTENAYRLSTGKAAIVLQRSRYAVYMKAKLLGLDEMINGSK